MQLTKLTVNQLPGIGDRFEISELKTVTIIHGPNGSGKSSLTLAIRKLLWKEIATGSPFSVEAVFNYETNLWRTSRNTREDPQWTLNGKIKTPPLLPVGHVGECYKMGVLDLVVPAAGEVENKLANIINIEMYGGIDLEKVKKDFFVIRPRLANDPSSKLDQAISNHSDLLATQTQLALAQNRLPALISDLEQKGLAKSKLELLKSYQARELIAIELEVIAEKLGSYNSGQKHILEKDGDDLSHWLADQERGQRESATLEKKIATRNEQIESLNFPAGSLDKTDIPYLGKRIGQASETATVVASLERDILTQEVIIHELLKVLDPRILAPERELLCDGLVYTELSSKYSLLTSHLAQIHGWTQVQSKLNTSHTPPPEEPENLDFVLRNWLKSSFNGAGKLSWILPLLGWLVLSSWYYWSPALALGPLFIFAGGIQWLTARRKHQQNTRDLADLCQSFDLEIPNNFDDHDVINLLVISSHNRGLLKTHNNVSDLLKTELRTLSEQSNQYNSQIAKLSKQFGLSLSETHITFLRLLDEIPAFRQAQQKRAILQENLKIQQTEFKNKFLGISNSFDVLGWEKPVDLKNAQHLFDNLQNHVEKLTKLTDEQPVDLDQLKNLKNSQSRIQTSLDRLWKRLEIEPQSDNQLVLSMVQKQSEWISIQAELARLQAQYDAKNQILSSKPNILSIGSIESLNSLELENMMAQLEWDQDTRDDVLKEINNTENKLQTALHSSQIAEASALCQQAESALNDTRAQEYEAQLGQLLLADVGESYQRNSQPAVLAKASQNFSDFTQKAYDLRIRSGKENQGQFFALEHDTGAAYGLAELSDGTRAQLLLAVRLAFITENERGIHPPVFLDESLTASDPERFAAIALNLSHWAHDQNRQVFYLTSNPGDAQAWQTALQNSKLPQPKLIDLALVRNMQKGLAGSIPLIVPDLPVAPQNYTAQQYAKLLKIPRLDGWKKHTEAHLWHFLPDDLPLLHRLLLASTPTWGRWNAHKENMNSMAQMSSQKISRLSARGRCLELFLNQWRIGRGATLASDTLLNSGQVSDNYLEKCRVLLAEEHGQAAAFITALRLKKVPRFQKEKIKLLEEFFIQEGYIDSRETLSTDELISNTTAGLAFEINNGHLSVPVIRNFILTWQQAVEFN